VLVAHVVLERFLAEEARRRTGRWGSLGHGRRLLHRERQDEARATAPAGGAARERLEDGLALLGGHARAVVVDEDGADARQRRGADSGKIPA
jgi:hypothetical protein